MNKTSSTLPANGIMRLDKIGDLKKFKVVSADLSSEYWSPKEVGETRLMVFLGIEDREAPDFNDPNKKVTLETAVFAEPVGERFKTVTSAAKVLVSRLKEKEVPVGTPVEVSFSGTKKNKNNNFQSNQWSIYILEDAK